MDTRELDLQRQQVGALFTAALNGDESALRVRIEAFEAQKAGDGAKAVLGCRDAKRHTALHFAANGCHAGCVRFLLSVAEDAAEAANAQDEDGTTPLMLAIIGGSEGSLDCIDALLAAGADPNLQRKQQRDTALHIAARNDQPEAARKLLAAGADLSLHSLLGTPLHDAASSGSSDVLALLLAAVREQHGDELLPLWLGSTGAGGVTPLTLAAASRHESAASSLVAAGSPLASAAEAGMTAVHFVCESGHADAVEAVAARADEGDEEALAALSAPNDDGLLPVQLAAAGGHSALVERLWRHTAGEAGEIAGHSAAEQLLAAEQARRRAEKPAETTTEGEAADAAEAAEAAEADSSSSSSSSTTTDPEAALAKKEEGNVAFKAGRLEEAEALYSESISLDPSSAVPFLNRSAARLKLGRKLEAVEDAVAARKLDAKSAKACYREGMARLACEQFQEAAEAFFEGFQLDRSNKELERRFKQAVELGKRAHKRKAAQEEEQARVRHARAAAAEARFRVAMRQAKAKAAGSKSAKAAGEATK